MSELTKPFLISSLSSLGNLLLSANPDLKHVLDEEQIYNAWFTPQNVTRSAQATGQMLNQKDLAQWLQPGNIVDSPKKIGLVLAGNIPMVGFHDVICVLASGNHAMIKTASQDSRLIPWLLKQLCAIAPQFQNRYSFVDRLTGFDAVIATGSNNTSRYFDYYFVGVPHIIRKNRNSIAVLTGNEKPAELQLLGHDIFDYFGLGCRSISKLLVPQGYDFVAFFEALESFHPIINHHKYNNNYDYNKSIYLVNLEKHLDNGFLLLKEDEKMASPLAVAFYENYQNLSAVEDQLNAKQADIQCVVSHAKLGIPGQVVPFGESQYPRLWDYADNVNTMDFLATV